MLKKGDKVQMNNNDLMKENHMNGLENYSTKELVEELIKREGVISRDAAPDDSFQLKITGPAIVLTVID